MIGGVEMYYLTVPDVQGYEIHALAETPQKCIDLVKREYRHQFGSFSENGFKNATDWLEWHGIGIDTCQEVKLNTAWTD